MCKPDKCAQDDTAHGTLKDIGPQQLILPPRTNSGRAYHYTSDISHRIPLGYCYSPLRRVASSIPYSTPKPLGHCHVGVALNSSADPCMSYPPSFWLRLSVDGEEQGGKIALHATTQTS